MEYNLEQKIMRQVRRTYYLKKVMNPLMLKVYSLMVAFLGMSYFVSFVQVFNNMPSLLEVGSMARFVMSAVTHTEAPVQLVLVVGAVLMALLIRDTAKNLTYSGQLVLE
ncbi:MAG: hypothetical protein WD509_00515 [Candidatus Paceibacterota bacterium]